MSRFDDTRKRARQSAVFLDRDGTLIEDRSHLRAAAQVAFFPDTVASLRLLQQD